MKISWIRSCHSLVLVWSLLFGQFFTNEILAEDNGPRTLWEKRNSDGDVTFSINLNTVPNWGSKIYEGQICPSRNPPANDDVVCYDSEGVEGGNANINYHTRTFFSEAMSDSNYGPHQLSCQAMNNPSRLAKPCIGNPDGTPKLPRDGGPAEPNFCYSDYECCSGYCEPPSGLNFLDEANIRSITKGAKGTCKAKPNGNYFSVWPFRPSGRPSGSNCANDSECQSKRCEPDPGSGNVRTCKVARFCKRCTPPGKRATFGAPCCGQSSITADNNICVDIDKTFMPAEIADVLGTNAAGVTKAEQLTDGDFTSDFSIFVTPKEQIRNGGSCSFQYRVNGQNQSAANAARGSGGGSIETENKALGLAMTKSLEVKESIVSAFEFLQLFNHGKPDSDTTLMADDVFGIHKTLRSALLRISKSRYQAFMDQKNLDKELGEEVLALQAMNDPALYQRLMREGSDNVKTLIANLEAKRGTAEGADFQKSMMVFQIRSAEKMAEISANRKRDLQDSFVELMDNYEKDEKDLDRSDAGGSNPKKFTLFTWLKDNRRAGETATSRAWTYLTDTNQNNDGISHDDAGDKKQWAPQEEVNEGGWDAEEGEEGRESCNIQTGVIFRTSTRCKYTHLQEEVTEAVGEYETEESFNWEMSRYCIGKGAGHDSKAGKGFSKALNLTSYPFFQRNQLKEVMKELDYDWLENELDLKMTYITTYPALLYNKDGVEQAEANLSRNIRENFRAYIEDPVKYTRGFDAIRGQAAAGTNFFGTSYKEALSQLAADDFDMLEHIVYLTSASYTRMQPAEYRASVILFLGRIVEDLARVYGELESGFIQQKDCYQGVLDQLGGSGPGNNRNRPTIGFGAPGAGSVAAPLGVVDVTGAGNGGSGSGVGFGNGGSGIGFGGFQGGVGLSAGGSFNTLADQKRQENFNRLSTDMNNIFSSFAKRKERFNKNFKGMAIARRQNALGGMLRKGVKSIIEDARKANQLASAKLRGQGTSSGSSLNGLINGSANNSGSGSGSGTADNSDAERLKRLRDNMNGEGGGGNRGGGGGGGGLFGGGDSGGSNGGNSFAGRSGGGTEDTHGLIDAAKRDRGELENKEDDSIFKIITNRYMKSLDKILIRKK